MHWKKTFTTARNGLHSSYDHGLDALLDRLGLEQRKDTLDTLVPTLGIFSAGLIVGAGLGLLFSPKRGEELRGDIRHRLMDLWERGQHRYQDLRHIGHEELEEFRVSEHAGAAPMERDG